MTWTRSISLAVLVFLVTGCGGGGTPQGGDESSKPAGETAAAKKEVEGKYSELFVAPQVQPPEYSTPAPSSSFSDPPSPAPPDASQSSSPEESLRAVVLQLTSDDLRVRGRAADLLEQAENSVPRCLELLNDKDAAVRRGAAFFLLGKFNAGNSLVDDALIAALADDDAGVRHIVLQAVNELNDAAVLPAVGQLARMLDNPQEESHQRAQVARRLGRLGPQAGEALPTIRKVGRGDADRDIRAACLYAVYRVAGRDEAVDVFREVLRSDSDAGLRGVAASRLGEYAAAVAVADLTAALDAERDSAVRGKIAEALARIGQPALNALLQRFGADDREVRILAIFAVGRMGPAAAQAIPQLERLRNDADRDVRLAAELSIRRIQGGP